MHIATHCHRLSELSHTLNISELSQHSHLTGAVGSFIEQPTGHPFFGGGGWKDESEIVTVMKTYLNTTKSKYSITVKENATKNKEIICNI